jgi:hypothetical protein
MPFTFNLTVHPKPEGNHRPKVDMEINIPSASYPHSPHLEGINLILPFDRISRTKETGRSWLTIFKMGYIRDFLIKKRTNGKFPTFNIILPDAIYEREDKKDSIGQGFWSGMNYHIFVNYGMTTALVIICLAALLLGFAMKIFPLAVLGSISLGFSMAIVDLIPFKVKFNSYNLVEKGYLSEDRRINKTFYLPWRPGQNPDYSDFINLFKQIPELLKRQLENDYGSGKTEGVTIKFGNIDSGKAGRKPRYDNAEMH